jgi:ABC-2 type transport system permease protein
MKATVLAEFRKVFTIRSTYYILLFVLALEIFFAFFISGWRIDAQDLHNPTTLANDITSAVAAVSVFGALVAVFLLTHEYRYNTVLYTLTASNSRSKVLLAKILVITGFSLVFTAIVATLSPLLSVLGMHLHHLTLVPQTLHYGNLVWRSLFFGWGYAMAGLLIATLVRNQIGAIVILFLFPDTIEALLSLLFKANTVYLPFTALHTVIGQTMLPNLKPISDLQASLVFGAYLVVGWIVAWILFLRRDTT